MYDDRIHERFDEIVIVLVCKYGDELRYPNYRLKRLSKTLPIKQVLRVCLNVDNPGKEPPPYYARISYLIESGRLTANLENKTLDRGDRFIAYGPKLMTYEVLKLLKSLGYKEGSTVCPQHFTHERYTIYDDIDIKDIYYNYTN